MQKKKTKNKIVKKTKVNSKKNYKRLFEIIKYLSSGSLGMLSDIGIFAVLIWCCQVNVLIANGVAAILSTLLNYFLQRVWSFKAKNTVASSLLKYFNVWLFNLFFTMFYLFLTVEYWGLNSLWMKISTYAFITIWNYLLYKNYVYKK